MKQKLSVTLDENLLQEIDRIVQTGKFRNKSHFVEYSINDILKRESEKIKLGGDQNVSI
ncbi:MAG: ribbon-helix-helix domain-containing protein [Nanoarchaeota archaeon]